METLDGTEWDLLIVGTGLPQSLLALALSRSGKKILHIDQNDYYGGPEAAFSLQEVEEWGKGLADDPSSAAAFSSISITRPEPVDPDEGPTLSSSRAYNLALCPQLIYARSTLLQHLVSSKVYRQLEFLAVGSFWVYSLGADETASSPEVPTPVGGRLLRVPNGREDVFQDQVLDFKAKRALMKFLRFIADYEEQPEVWEDHRNKPFPSFLTEQFKIPASLHAPLLALTLSPAVPAQTTTDYALPRIARHLRSIGFFGAGFGSVIPKWGGMSEITQVACRASAVGGGVYVLDKGLSTLNGSITLDHAEGETPIYKVRLKDGELITTRQIVAEPSHPQLEGPAYCKSITVVSSTLDPLFPPIAEDAPSPACAVVIFPSGTLKLDTGDGEAEVPPVYISIHNSEAGECPAGQSVLYASIALKGTAGFQYLKKSVQALLLSVDVTPSPKTLLSVQYEQQSRPSMQLLASGKEPTSNSSSSSMDLAFDDSVLDQVKGVWQEILGEEAGEFLVFEDREPNINEDDE